MKGRTGGSDRKVPRKGRKKHTADDAEHAEMLFDVRTTLGKKAEIIHWATLSESV